MPYIRVGSHLNRKAQRPWILVLFLMQKANLKYGTKK